MGVGVALLSSAGCAGVRILKSVTVSERRHEFPVMVPGSAHNITFSFEDKIEGNADAWVKNRGNEAIGLYHLEFPKESIDSRSYAPTRTTKVLLAPGDTKKVFHGPADLLMCKFYSIAPGGAEISFEVIFSELPRNPVDGKIKYAFGGP
jgi:hypothetical protein